MKWQGISANTTPTDDTEGVAEEAYNSRLRIQGEMRRRRGLARSNLDKAAAGVTLINGFAIGQGQGFAIISSSGVIEGKETPEALWGDAVLIPISGFSSAVSTLYSLTIDRGDCLAMTSAIVFARAGAYPTDINQGTYVGEVSIDPWDTSVGTSWTAPEAGAWYFRAYPVRDREVGPGANLTPIDMGGYIASDYFIMDYRQLFPGFVDLECTVSTTGVGPYVTSNGLQPQFNIGAALAAGAITLPYLMTATPDNSSAGICDFLCTPYGWAASPAGKNWFAGVTAGVSTTTMTFSSGRGFAAS